MLPGLRPVGAPMLAMGRESSMAVEGARDVLGWVEVAKSRDAVRERQRGRLAAQAISHLQRQGRAEGVLSDRD